MILNNIYNLTEITRSIINQSSKPVKQNQENSKMVLLELADVINCNPIVSNRKYEVTDFIDRINSIIQKRVDDSAFDVKQLAMEMSISKSTLYKKINKCIKLTPFRLIHSLRIETAQQLLLSNYLNISEVAFKVGFNDPKYFSKCFKREVGYSPKKYRELMRQHFALANNQGSDDIFVEKAVMELEIKVLDENFSFDKFAYEMNVSKSTLNRKIKLLTGLSPCQFRQNAKIRKAEKLLSKREYKISELAYEVGFNDPKYFSRCFKIEYGVAPSEFLESHRHNRYEFI